MTQSPAVRPYRSDDREALYRICIPTTPDENENENRPVYADPAIFPAAPYIHLEPELAFVLDDSEGQAVGYVIGTADTLRFVEAFRTRWLPLVADRFPEPVGAPATLDEAIIQRLHHPEHMLVPEAAAYPAHLHIELLPEWRGGGHGRALVRTFLQALRSRDVPAVHLSVATANTSARAFYDRLGFHEIEVAHAGPITCLGRTTKGADEL